MWCLCPGEFLLNLSSNFGGTSTNRSGIPQRVKATRKWQSSWLIIHPPAVSADVCECAAKNNACRPVIVNDQKHIFSDGEGHTATTSPSPSCDAKKKNSQQWRRGVALIGYAAFQELLNNGGVHSQSSWKKNALIFHASLVSSPSPFVAPRREREPLRESSRACT